MPGQPNVLFVMTDQQRFDTIAALGNPHIHTPNMDRLVARGVAFTNAYTPSPECAPARYSMMSGSEATATGSWSNIVPPTIHADIEGKCGPYLPAVMRSLGYRTFGIGKMHTRPWDADMGFDVDLRSEELYISPDHRARDAYASWIAREHPAFDFIEQLMGERTEMYYVPQMSPLPAELNVEAWAAHQAVEQIDSSDGRPWFGLVSFIGPHPPLAPPIPYNRMYDPDRLPEPVVGDLAVDHLDDFLPWMSYGVFAEDISPAMARIIKARYYGEITYIDQCLGRILDAVDARPDADNTLICFYTDHGDHLGDHNAWQKESFFEAAARVPLLLSWPAELPAGERSHALTGLVDLFAIATAAAGAVEARDGMDMIDVANGGAARHTLFSWYGNPGTRYFKCMVRRDQWKYVFIANGGHDLLFDVDADPEERKPRQDDEPAVAGELRSEAVRHLADRGWGVALEDDDLLRLPFEPFKRKRIYQFEYSRGVVNFPDHPADLLTEAALR